MREVDIQLKNFELAINRLELALQYNIDEVDIALDAIIQRFELSFEMAWKSIRLIAKIVGHDCRSPRGCLKLAYSMGWIDDEEKWLKLLEARNQTSHTYNLYIALDVYITVKENSQVFHNLLKKLKTEI